MREVEKVGEGRWKVKDRSITIEQLNHKDGRAYSVQYGGLEILCYELKDVRETIETICARTPDKETTT